MDDPMELQRRAWMNTRERGFQGLLGRLLVVVGLEIEPHPGRPAEIAFEAQRRIDGQRALAFDDFVDAPGRDPDILGDTVFRKSERDEKILAQDFAGMNGCMRFHGGSVVIDDFHFISTVGFPFLEQASGFPAGEGTDHRAGSNITRGVMLSRL